MTDIDTICKTLPNATNSNKFVDVLRSHTRYAQLSGSDYRSILLRVLADDVTESRGRQFVLKSGGDKRSDEKTLQQDGKNIE